MFLPRILLGVTVRLSLSISLLCVTAMSFAGPYGDLKQRLDQTQSDADAIRLVKSDPRVASQADIRNSLNSADLGDDALAETLRAQVALGAMAESRTPASNLQTEQAKSIKASPFYSDQGIDKKRNWFSEAIDRIRNIHLDIKQKPMVNVDPGLFGPSLVVIVWFVLAVGVLALIVFAARHIRWKRTLTRKAKTLLEEDEPERTLDEWLAVADEHAAAGRFRQAVRALFLACLLRFDEADIARFDRGETNWEHLLRIEESGKMPDGLDFRNPTRRFDVIWYGQQTAAMSDVEQFRAWYGQLVSLTTKAAA